MTRHLDRDMDALQQLVLAMAENVKEALYKAIETLQHGNKDLAAEVIDAEDRVDDLDNLITNECLKLWVLRQPVACDLRRIAVVFMIRNDLERMADLAGDIAGRSNALGQLHAQPIASTLAHMTDTTVSMVKLSLDAFVSLDARQARFVIRMDDEVDQCNKEIIDELIALMKQDPQNVEPGIALFSAVRDLERIADHATNIAEDLLFLLDGDLIRHRRRTELEPPTA